MSLKNFLTQLVHLRAGSCTLAVSRIAMGVCSFAVALESWRTLSRILSPQVIQLPYFNWLPRLSLGFLPIFSAVWLLAAVALTIGFKTRSAAAIITSFSAYTLMFDQQTYSNHFYLFFLIMLLLTVADSGAVLSIDAVRRNKRKNVAAWPVVLLRSQVSIVYGFSAVAKLTPQFLTGEMLSQTLRKDGWLVFPEHWRGSGLMVALAVAAIIFELFIAVGLWNRRTRLLAVIAGILLHAFIITMLDSSRLALGIFALEMFALYPLFFQSLNYDDSPDNSTSRVVRFS